MFILGGAIGLIWVTIGVVVYRSFFRKPAPVAPLSVVVPVATPGVGAGPGGQVPPAGTLTPSGRDLLQDPAFTGLKVYADIPLQPGRLGRPNPFEPTR